jgi:hypothetical protein
MRGLPQAGGEKASVAPQAAVQRSARCAPRGGCVTGSGNLETKSFSLESFDAIEANPWVEVDVTQSDQFAVSVTADDTIWSTVEVSVDRGTLRIRMDPAAHGAMPARKAPVTLSGRPSPAAGPASRPCARAGAGPSRARPNSRGAP